MFKTINNNTIFYSTLSENSPRLVLFPDQRSDCKCCRITSTRLAT